jgi:PilZ domain
MQDRRKRGAERRRGRRAPFVAAVKHKVGGEVQLALAQNLGPTGIELKRPAGRAYMPRTPVTLAFELPDGGDVVRVQGAIVFERAAGPGYQTTGVRFLAMTPLDHARIIRALRYL